MATRTIEEKIDDIDGALLGDDGETIEFTFDGVEYAIDLSSKNASALRDAIRPYLDNAQKVGGRKKRRSAGEKRDPNQTKAIREWAQSAGHEVSARGRIPETIIEAFNKAHS